MSNYIKLTLLEEHDIPILFQWINDRELVILNAPYRSISWEEHLSWFKSIRKKDNVRIFAIRFKENNQLIGTCQLLNIHPTHRAAELQIRIGEPRYRGLGYGGKALRQLLQFGFKELNLQRIYLHVFATNIPAIKAYEKIGFVQEGLLRKAAFIEGQYLDVIVMGYLAEAYV